MKNHKLTAEPFIHATVWICCYLFVIMVVKTIGPFKKVDHTLVMPVTFGTIINIILFYITSIVLIPRFSGNKRISEFLALILALLIFLTVIETFTDKTFFRYYYSDSEESFKAQFILNFVLNIIMLSLALGYGFTRSWYRNEEIKQMLIREKLSSELNLLRSQLNPHFLFNVLNMAFSSASRSGDERTADIIEKLSGLMRYTTYESNVEKIGLEKEIEYLQNYIDLQKMRFSDEMPVKVNFRVNGDVGSCRITPLILVQFVENAFKHGVRLGKESEIDISINVSDHKMEFITRNPFFGKSYTSNDRNSGIGIENVRKRLSILYPGKHNLDIDETGELFIVKLIMDLE